MNNIQKYFAGREQFIELLEAVGIRTLEQFASADPSHVFALQIKQIQSILCRYFLNFFCLETR